MMEPQSAPAQGPSGAWSAFDQLATLVAIVQRDGRCLFVNACFEDVVGVSRRGLT